MKTKMVPVPPTAAEDPFPDKVSLQELRKIWDDDYYTYTDDELMRIREWLYALAAIAIRFRRENPEYDEPGGKLVQVYRPKKAS